MIVDAETLASVRFDPVVPYLDWNPKAVSFLEGPAGREPYRLIAALAAALKDPERPMVDIGTYMGASALAMALDIDQPVVTYDVCDWIGANPEQTIGRKTVSDRTNVSYRLMDCRTSSELKDVLAPAPLISLDIDPHNGIEEKAIVADLEHVGFKGILVLDDIHLNDGMEAFWESLSIRHKKQLRDVTSLGHWSGTGLVLFGQPDVVDVRA